MEKKSDDRPATARRRDAKEERMGRAGVVLIVCLCTLPFLVFLFGGRAGAPAVWRNADKLTATAGSGLVNVSRPSAGGGADELFGGLLAPGSDRCACLSRYQSPRYYKHSPHAPSPHLLQKLRDYEARHSKCGPGALSYARSVDHLRSGGGSSTEDDECNYVVWIPYNGLGNRMLSLLSTFLYALLTGRVLLVHPTDDFTDLFCEPFLGGTWALPPDFPVADMSRLGARSNESYGNLLDGKRISNDPTKATARSVPPYVYLHLAHDLRRSDRRFYCNDDQLVLAKVNWLLLQNDFYFVPALYDMAEFEGELRRLFPAMESASHLLGRYLFHPSNSVWGMITRYYHSYLAHAEERIGVQIRMFSWASIPVHDIYNQIMACSEIPNCGGFLQFTRVLPTGAHTAGRRQRRGEHDERRGRRLQQIQGHLDRVAAGRVLREDQVDGLRARGGGRRPAKALAEIYLLSFSDVLLTTGISTFGYMSSSLAGLRPTMLTIAKDQKVPDTPCVHAVSMEPCFHMTPDVKCHGKAVNKEELSRHVKECENVPKGMKWIKGVKLVD
ncbi:Galactoside 2-alpha-L-fucosyltransferase [Triticum urartu]|uniref:Fucosyltransferase n=1 Tax=Triticum urartu TaxID=4572 RepID=M7YXC3_TRIUA|nr:Galactoside 2-alpha-L-fucosyltransferase [Triticum urartu]